MYVSHSLRVAVEDVKSDGSNHFFFPLQLLTTLYKFWPGQGTSVGV